VAAWAAWAGAFVVIEGLAFARGGVTLSGLVWYLRHSPVVVQALVGALAVTVFSWCIWHWWIEHDYFPHLRGTLKDDGIIALVFLALALLSAALRRRP
jgi:DMSO/TMAO reductase YedYZ heme-binding membrane subunit